MAERPDAAAVKEEPHCAHCGQLVSNCNCPVILSRYAPPSDAEGFDSSGPWTAFSTVLYEGREYAMVMQRDRPWFCSRSAGTYEPWVVIAAAHEEG